MRTIEIIERPNRIDTIINFDNIEVTAFFSDNRKACQYNPKRNIGTRHGNNHSHITYPSSE